MKLLKQSVHVSFHYNVYFTRDVFSVTNTTLRDVVLSSSEVSRKLLVIIESGVANACSALTSQVLEYGRHFAQDIELVAPPLIVPGGERVKESERYVDVVRSAINEHGICRHSYVVAVGGGALLDMVGYAAATSHRGVRLIRVPTTVLAQDDSGVGVKNGVNAFGKKNFVGTFAPPVAVINDSAFLDALSDREWRSGLAEAVKVALIKDGAFFDRLESLKGDLLRRDRDAMESVIFRCAELHLQHIAGADPFETGSSRPLDFGHWAAHKLEQLTNYRLRHGEAVAVGIALDSTYSYVTGRLPEQSWKRILNLLAGMGFDLNLLQLDMRQLAKGLDEFREHLGGELTIMLLSEIGRGVEVHSIDMNLMEHSAALLSRSGVVAAASDPSIEELVR